LEFVLLDVNFWEGLAWIFWVFILMMVIWMFIAIFADIFRRDDLSGWGKVLWVLAIFVLPFLGILFYIAFRPKMPMETWEPGATTAGGASGGAASSATAEIAQAQQLLTSGAITQEEFDKIKQRALS
jgi:D-alanyl-lipoteichoic acid acyltransferase DltB (MBOAT superfamily)